MFFIHIKRRSVDIGWYDTGASFKTPEEARIFSRDYFRDKNITDVKILEHQTGWEEIQKID